jgi:aryl-alcohol dehydrogenase-like predicted oxidoreductase
MRAALQPEHLLGLGQTGVSVPVVGYGTAPLGKDRVSRDHAVHCLHHATNLGIS